MLRDLPFYLPLLFIFTVVLTFVFFLAAIKKNNSNKKVLLISLLLVTWLALHAILGLDGFYTVTGNTPPRFALSVAPAFLFIIILFLMPSGRKFVDTLSPEILTRLHIVRVFVEIILWWLFLEKYIPKIMTFEGRNFDIVAGVTAPFIAYFGYLKRSLSRMFMLLWNIACLLLLINIIVIAILSAPFTFQQFAFDQPNVAVLYFPFVWLPCFIVPVVLFSHLALIRKLLKH